MSIQNEILDDFIINYLSQHGESRYSDFQKAAIQAGYTAGQISSKSRTMKAAGVIFQRNNGAYVLAHTLCYKNELLDDINALLNKYNLNPKDLAHEPDVNAFYALYTDLNGIKTSHCTGDEADGEK